MAVYFIPLAECFPNSVENVVAKSKRTLGMIKRGLCFAPIETKLRRTGIENNLERMQRNAVKWIYYLKRLESVSECITKNSICLLSDRRDKLDAIFLRKIEAGLFEVQLNQ